MQVFNIKILHNNANFFFGDIQIFPILNFLLKSEIYG